MKTILKFKWLISIIVIIAVACSLIFSPNLAQLAADKGEIIPPKDTTSQQYEQILKDVNADSNSISAVVQLDNKLDNQDEKKLKSYISKIENVNGVKNVISPFDNSAIEDKLVSEDKKSIMIPIETSANKDKSLEASKDIDDINHSFKGSYLTGTNNIQDQINTSINEGLKTTEVITVILILGILFLVFRSVVTPFVPLFYSWIILYIFTRHHCIISEIR
ncbi:MMPL family transporter [Staphylococcus arlettae]|uniref:MMPL family transporter n=1 Tax=Staphylococcus arlettae TaxID=29378 RepID=UPI0022B5772F|nr:MMPL family transporter [Staphylococcus arlettae]